MEESIWSIWNITIKICKFTAIDADFGFRVDFDTMEVNDYFKDVQIERCIEYTM